MSIIRWKNIQNIKTTEAEINFLAGLTAVANEINRISGYSYTGAELNSAVESISTLAEHILTPLIHSHPLEVNSVHGALLINGTLLKEKMGFDVATLGDLNPAIIRINEMAELQEQLDSQIKNLYDLVIPNQSNELAQSIVDAIAHIEDPKNAHDSSAISYGNNYPILTDIQIGSQQFLVDKKHIRFFRRGDSLLLEDRINEEEVVNVVAVNYETGHVGFEPSAEKEYKTSQLSTVTILSEDNVQDALTRCLRNNTDSFSGKLSITQTEESGEAITIDNSAILWEETPTMTIRSGFSMIAEDFLLRTNKDFRLTDKDNKEIFSVTKAGHGRINTLSLYSGLNSGLISKQPLTVNRGWMFPDRSGYVGIGDLTFQDLLKVKLINGTQISVAPGFMFDVEGQKVSAWTTMEEPSKYEGETINILSKLVEDGKHLELTDQWMVIVPFLNERDLVHFSYGPICPTKEEAIEDYENLVPAAYMKLAKIIVKGNGFENIVSGETQILEDMRPIFTMGLSAAFYDETVTFATGAAHGTEILLPRNSRKGGLRQTYKMNTAQLEVYLDGVYQRQNIDYIEFREVPEGSIRLLKPLQPESTIRFRITYTAAAVSGGIQTTTLHTAYVSGPIISASDMYGPIEIFAYGLDDSLVVHSGVIVEGMIKELLGLSFKATNSIGSSTNPQLYVNKTNELVLKSPSNVEYNFNQEIIGAQESQIISLYNGTDTAIDFASAVSLNTGLVDHIVLTNCERKTKEAICIGIAIEEILPGEHGKVVIGGRAKAVAQSIPHGNLVVIDPSTPGRLVDANSTVFDPLNAKVIVGIVNGSDIILSIKNEEAEKEEYSLRKAGEFLPRNKVKLVRLGKGNETHGAVYLCNPLDANIDQNFWAIGIVKPTKDVLVGEDVKVYSKFNYPINISSTDTFFSLENVGYPFYLAQDGNIAPFSGLLFTGGEAIVKCGMIEGMRSVSFSGVQVMSTHPYGVV